MFYKVQSDKKHIFVNNLKLDKVDKKKESKTTPRVNVNISVYDKVLQVITNDSKRKTATRRRKQRIHRSV